MEIVICKNREQAAKMAARMITEAVNKKPNLVLGLATGSTPVQMYNEMAKAVKEGKASYKKVKTWNLDEYVGLSGNNPQSYRYFMNENLFGKIDIPMRNTHLLNGLAKDLDKECSNYESAIKRAGGIDIQVLGIGSDGHIAFNEPGDAFIKETHVVSLKKSTIEANKRFFTSIDQVPTQAITMGVGSIMQAKKVLLLAEGPVKKNALEKALYGPICPQMPASILQLHPDLTVICHVDG